MAGLPKARVNNLNQRMHDVGIWDQDLTLEDVRAVNAFYDYTCLNCGAKPAISVDHVKPIMSGGTNTLDNLQNLCESCNKAKGQKEIDYRGGKVLTQEIASDYVNKLESGEIVEHSNYGGRRFGAGRKPFAATVLRRRMIEDKVDEAEASFAYLVAVRDNEEEPSQLRLAAAQLILDRVLGKPTERSEQQKQVIIQVVREERNLNQFAPVALITAGN